MVVANTPFSDRIKEALPVRPVSHGIDRVEVTFDEPGLVANAGLLLVATLVKRLALEAVIDTTVRIPSKLGGLAPGRKVLTLVHAMVAGATHIDHADVLRAGATGTVLSHRVMAPSTLGTFLRAFTFGHVRQLEAVVGEALRRAWSAMTLPSRLVVDVDSTICEVAGKKKAGAAYGYTKVLGLHPLLATRADTGELLHARLRKGSANTQRGAKRFVEELVARLRRAGATGTLVMRFDSGFWSKDLLSTLERLSVSYTMAVRANTKAIAQVIATIAEEDWVPIAYPQGGEAAVAETDLQGKAPRRPAHPAPGARGHAVAGLASLRIPHRPDRQCPRDRRLPSRAGPGRARHTRPERGGGHGALPVGKLRCQRRLAPVRRPGPQPASLDPGLGRSPRSRRPPSGRRSDHPHALRLAARSARQPLGDADAAWTEPLAVAGAVHHRALEPACPCGRRHLKRRYAVGAAADDPHQCADIPPTTRASGRRRPRSAPARASAARTVPVRPPGHRHVVSRGYAVDRG
jgi:PII-like signaling protein